MSRHFIAFTLSLLFVLLPLTSCESGNLPSGKGTSEPLPVVVDGATDYVLVRSDIYASSNIIVKTAVAMRNIIRGVTGAEIQIKTDWDGTEDNSLRKEILVGDTNRQESIDALLQLGDNQYIIKVCGDGTKIVITGKTERATEAAVMYFCETYLGYRSETDFDSSPNITLPLGIETVRSYTGSSGEIITAGSNAESSLIFENAGTVTDGKRALARTDVLIYRLYGTKGGLYTVSFDIEGQYLVTVSTDNETFYRLFAFADDGYGTPRGNYSADLTEYFASADTVYIRITDYHPLDNNSPVIYSLTLSDESDRVLE